MTEPTSARIPRGRAKTRRRRPSPLLSSASTLLLASTCLSPRLPLLPPAAAQCNPCEGRSGGFVQIPDTGCAEFAQCDSNGEVSQRFTCQGELVYDAILSQCNWAFAATCGPDPSCPPTGAPTDGPSGASTDAPTRPPATFEPTLPPVAVVVEAPSGGGGGGADNMPSLPKNPPGKSPGANNPLTVPPAASPALPPSGGGSVGGPGGLPPLRYEHHAAVWAHLNANKIPFSNQLLRSARRTLRNLHGNNVDADELRNYGYYDFYGALRSMAEEGYAVPVAAGEGERQAARLEGGNGGEGGGAPPPQVLAREVFYLGDPQYENAAAVGLVNVAAFLSQAMADSISSGSCDELNEELVDGALPASNACGQFGRSYQDMRCPGGEEHLECVPYPDMEAGAQPNGRPVAPFYCGSTERYPFTGTADYIAGRAPADVPVPNQNGRTDVEGCCWWGRGTLQTRGVCQYGKLDYYLGARAAREGRPARYPHLDFCASPQSVCSDLPGDSMVEWITGLFRWIDSVQTYESYNDDGSVGWSYVQKLHEFVMGGMMDGMFIRSVSSIVTFGCHEAPCPGAEDTLVEMTDAGERWSYFLQVLEALGLPVKALRQE